MRLHLNITQNIYIDRKTKYIIELASITVVNTDGPHKKINTDRPRNHNHNVLK